MRKLLFSFVLFLRVAVAKAQTETETIEWLNAKLPPLCQEVIAKHLKFTNKGWEWLKSYYAGTDKKSNVVHITPAYISNITVKKYSEVTTIVLTSKDNKFLEVKYSSADGQTPGT